MKSRLGGVVEDQPDVCELIGQPSELVVTVASVVGRTDEATD